MGNGSRLIYSEKRQIMTKYDIEFLRRPVYCQPVEDAIINSIYSHLPEDVRKCHYQNHPIRTEDSHLKQGKLLMQALEDDLTVLNIVKVAVFPFKKFYVEFWINRSLFTPAISFSSESPETVSMSALAYNLLFRGVDIAILSEGEEDINLLPSELIPIDEIKIPPLIKFSRKAACQCLSEVLRLDGKFSSISKDHIKYNIPHVCGRQSKLCRCIKASQNQFGLVCNCENDGKSFPEGFRKGLSERNGSSVATGTTLPSNPFTKEAEMSPKASQVVSQIPKPSGIESSLDSFDREQDIDVAGDYSELIRDAYRRQRDNNWQLDQLNYRLAKRQQPSSSNSSNSSSTGAGTGTVSNSRIKPQPTQTTTINMKNARAPVGMYNSERDWEVYGENRPRRLGTLFMVYPWFNTTAFWIMFFLALLFTLIICIVCWIVLCCIY
ncbi:uncharacterized protein LOC142338292 isoform X2 [Convolutriloba macropyga]|uniref:uncharacterized protein LOC142338292 isoform X2 n=1 Tax=Convolutriloba macropyga TaxID=536237 RepID=UPI003F51C3BF